MVYLFDAAGQLLKGFDTVALCASKLGISRSTVSNALSLGSLVQKQYYVSKTKTIDLAQLRTANNVLLISNYKAGERPRHRRDTPLMLGALLQEEDFNLRLY